MTFIPWETLVEAPPPTAAAAAPAKPVETARTQLIGLLMVAASSAAFSISNLIINVLSSIPPVVITPFQVAFVRFLVQFFLSICATLLVHRDALADRRTWLGQPGNLLKLVTRGLVGTLGLVFFVLTLSQMTLSDASAITFLNIPLTAIFARLFLGEEYTLFDAATGLLGVLGVVLVAQPASIFGAAPGIVRRELSAGSVVIGLCAATFTSFAFLAIRRIGSGEDPFVITLWFSAVGIVVTPALMLAQGGWVAPPTATHAWLLAGVGVLGFIGQLLLNRGMAVAPSGPASVMRYLDLVNALWMQSLLLNDVPNALKWCGSLLVLSSVLSTVHKARRKSQREKAKAAALEGALDSSAAAPAPQP